MIIHGQYTPYTAEKGVRITHSGIEKNPSIYLIIFHYIFKSSFANEMITQNFTTINKGK